MRALGTMAAIAVGLFLGFGVRAQADLLDLRGKTFFITGKLLVSGEALGKNLADYFPDGIDITSEYAAAIVINNTGDDNNLSGTFLIPTIPSTVSGYPVVTNPSIPLTGSFNRSNGALSVSGQINGITVLDFGVHDTGSQGVKRILVQVKNLRIAATATGTVDPDGAFRIKQPGVTSLLFDINSNPFSGTPRVALQDPNQTGFPPFISAVITNPSFRLSNWIAAEPTWSGTIQLEGNTSAAYPLTFAFTGPAPADNFARTITPNADGTFFLPNIPAKPYTVGIKGDKFLRQTVTVPFDDGDANPAEYPALFLRTGDGNNDNFVDVTDLLLIINHYNKTQGSAGYLEGADFNSDGANDVADLLLVIGNYNRQGDN